MRIVHVTGYFVPELGYQEYYLARKHKELGHDVYVVTSDMLYPFPNLEGMLKEAGVKNTSRKRRPGFVAVDGIKVYRLRHFFEFYDLILCRGLKKTLEKIKPDVVFSHECRQGIPALPGWWKKELGYKFIIDQHDFYHNIPNQSFFKKFLRFLDYFFLRNFPVNYGLSKADKMVAVTEETKRFLIKNHRMPPENIEHIPLGVDTDFFRFGSEKRQHIRKNLGIKKDEVAIVFSGTIVRRKGLEILFKAFSDINNKKCRLLIVGSGDEKYIEELKNLSSELNIKDRTIFTGFVSKNKVKDYFSAADIGVWPGNNSVSIMEAMACKLPIVMVDLQLSHLVSRGNGLKFKHGDIEGLKGYLEKLAKNKKMREDMGAKSLKFIKENYSYDTIAKKFLELAD